MFLSPCETGLFATATVGCFCITVPRKGTLGEGPVGEGPARQRTGASVQYYYSTVHCSALYSSCTLTWDAFLLFEKIRRCEKSMVSYPVNTVRVPWRVPYPWYCTKGAVPSVLYVYSIKGTVMTTERKGMGPLANGLVRGM